MQTHTHANTQLYTLTGNRNHKDLNNFSIVSPTQQWEKIMDTPIVSEKKTWVKSRISINSSISQFKDKIIVCVCVCMYICIVCRKCTRHFFHYCMYNNNNPGLAETVNGLGCSISCGRSQRLPTPPSVRPQTSSRGVARPSLICIWVIFMFEMQPTRSPSSVDAHFTNHTLPLPRLAFRRKFFVFCEHSLSP